MINVLDITHADGSHRGYHIPPCDEMPDGFTSTTGNRDLDRSACARAAFYAGQRQGIQKMSARIRVRARAVGKGGDAS